MIPVVIQLVLRVCMFRECLVYQRPLYSAGFGDDIHVYVCVNTHPDLTWPTWSDQNRFPVKSLDTLNCNSKLNQSATIFSSCYCISCLLPESVLQFTIDMAYLYLKYTYRLDKNADSLLNHFRLRQQNYWLKKIIR